MVNNDYVIFDSAVSSLNSLNYPLAINTSLEIILNYVKYIITNQKY